MRNTHPSVTTKKSGGEPKGKHNCHFLFLIDTSCLTYSKTR